MFYECVGCGFVSDTIHRFGYCRECGCRHYKVIL